MVRASCVDNLAADHREVRRRIGNLLLVANSQINIPLAFACLIGLAVIGIGLYGAVAAVELALKPWFGETVNG